MSEHIEVRRTAKLFIGGAFPRSESGRTYEVKSPEGKFIANAAQGSRKDARDAVTAAKFADSVGIGSYRMDLHTTTTGDHGAYGSTLPFQIPLGALIPQRVENLVPACKNLGVTHLTNGCYRLHPVEWNVGEAAGALVAFCLARRKSPRDVRRSATMLGEFQQLLMRDGVLLDWPRETGPI